MTKFVVGLLLGLSLSAAYAESDTLLDTLKTMKVFGQSGGLIIGTDWDWKPIIVDEDGYVICSHRKHDRR